MHLLRRGARAGAYRQRSALVRALRMSRIMNTLRGSRAVVHRRARARCVHAMHCARRIPAIRREREGEAVSVSTCRPRATSRGKCSLALQPQGCAGARRTPRSGHARPLRASPLPRQAQPLRAPLRTARRERERGRSTLRTPSPSPSAKHCPSRSTPAPRDGNGDGARRALHPLVGQPGTAALSPSITPPTNEEGRESPPGPRSRAHQARVP